MKKILVLLLILFSSFVNSQEIKKKYKFNFQLDNRYSSIRGNNIMIFGTKIGLQYRNLTRFGVGVSFIINPVDISYTNKKTQKVEDNKINFWYASIFSDWILYKNKKLECFVTEQIGYGKPNFVKEVDNEVVSNLTVPLLLNEISGQANYKITSWIGLGAGAGYRNLWNGNSNLKRTFDAPIYIVKVIIYPESFFSK